MRVLLKLLLCLLITVGLADNNKIQSIFPGQGGILDRLDSMIETWFVGYICLKYNII